VRKTGLALLLLASCQTAEELPDRVLPASAPDPRDDLFSPRTLPDPTTTTTEPEPTTTAAPVTTRYVKPVTTTEYLRPVATTAAVQGGSASLASIRACESEGDYTTDTGNGYYGAYQFHPQTWASVGGSGNPAHASPSEQDMRAQMMIDAGRRGEWPNC
jgi:hypothetical protein